MPTPLWGLILLDYLQVYFFSVSQFLVFLVSVVYSLSLKKKLFCIWKSIVKAMHIQPVEKYDS